MNNASKKKSAQPTVFESQVFSKRRDGVEHFGVILHARFRPMMGVKPGDLVQLREKDGRLEYFCDGHWRMALDGFPV